MDERIDYTKGEYTSRCHLVVDGAHVWPDTQENREAGRQTSVKLTAQEARRYGTDLVKVIAETKAVLETPQNKQLTTTRTK